MLSVVRSTQCNAAAMDSVLGLGLESDRSSAVFRTTDLSRLKWRKIASPPIDRPISDTLLFSSWQVRTRKMCWRLPTHLAHPLKDANAVVIHALGPSLQGSRQNRGEPCSLLPTDISRRGSVVVTTRRLCTINTRAPFDHVEVNLQNAALAKGEFGHRYKGELRTLAEDGAARSEKYVFDKLLLDGGSSANTTAFPIVLGSDLDLVPIEPMVLVEARVLRGDYGVLEIGGDLAERNEFVVFVIRSVVNPGLQAALDVHRG